jgi:hypothetical protein
MKTFAVRYGFIKSGDNEFVGGLDTNHHKQGALLINAKFKKDALAKMESLGYKVSATNCTIGSGNDMNALLEAGVINEDSLIVLPDNRPFYVARVWIDENGDRKVARIGELVNDKDAKVHSDKFVPTSAEG